MHKRYMYYSKDTYIKDIPRVETNYFFKTNGYYVAQGWGSMVSHVEIEEPKD